MNLAIFDLDETLISIDSDHAWNEFVVDRNLVDADLHREQNDRFYADYKAGKLDIDQYLRFACSVLTEYSLDELHQLREEFVADRIQPHVLPKAKEKVKEHRDRGDELIVITSTIQFVVDPIVELFGIPTVLAPVPELLEGRYTGRCVGVPSFREGKVTRWQSWLEDTAGVYDQTWFYSDSFNDLPLLHKVDHPVAVDPDDALRLQAEQNGWEIISLR